jgi:hypothetical protein
MMSLPTKKSLGYNGITAEFCLAFIEELSSMLLNIFHKI